MRSPSGKRGDVLMRRDFHIKSWRYPQLSWVAGKLRCAARSARLPVRGSLSIGAEWPGHKENNPSSYKGNGTGVAPLITLFAILFHANVDWDRGHRVR